MALLKNIIFDFDGTLANSFELFVGALSETLGRSEGLSTQEVEELRGMSIKDIMTKLGVKTWQIPRYLTAGRKLFTERYDEVEIYKGIKKMIQDLKESGHTLYVVSSNSTLAINEFMKMSGLTNHFRLVKGDVGLFGKSKALKKLIKNERLSKTETIYIGDEVRDIEAARKNGLIQIAVSWGYTNRKTLADTKPTMIADLPSDISKLIH